MGIEELRTASLNKLVELSYILEEQKMLNLVYYEIACRIYKPFGGKSFDELLLGLGYVPIPKVDKEQTK